MQGYSDPSVPLGETYVGANLSGHCETRSHQSFHCFLARNITGQFHA